MLYLSAKCALPRKTIRTRERKTKKRQWKKNTNTERYGKHRWKRKYEKLNERKAMTKFFCSTHAYIQKDRVGSGVMIEKNGNSYFLYNYKRISLACCCFCSKLNQWGSIRAIRHHFDYIKPFLSLPVFIFPLRCHVFRIISYIRLDTFYVFFFHLLFCCCCCCFLFIYPTCAALSFSIVFFILRSSIPVFGQKKSRDCKRNRREKKKNNTKNWRKRQIHNGQWTRSIFIIIVPLQRRI